MINPGKFCRLPEIRSFQPDLQLYKFYLPGFGNKPVREKISCLKKMIVKCNESNENVDHDGAIYLDSVLKHGRCYFVNIQPCTPIWPGTEGAVVAKLGFIYYFSGGVSEP